MAFRYCGCGQAMDKPTIQEDLIAGQICHHCGTKLSQWQSTEEWLVELAETIQELKQT